MGHGCGLDPVWLWLWCRPAAAAPFQPLAWELPYAADAALKKKKKITKKKLHEKDPGNNLWDSSVLLFHIQLTEPSSVFINIYLEPFALLIRLKNIQRKRAQVLHKS